MKAVFLDRDDTLIEDPGYITKPEQVKLIPGVGQALEQLKKLGFRLIIVTNQSGIARGMLTEAELEPIHQRLTNLLAAEDAYIDAIYYCPYHPDGTVPKYTRECTTRKPGPGMLLNAAEEHGIDLSQSWMIGDNYRDIEAGIAAGCRTILVDVPGKSRVKQSGDPEPERKAVNLREAVNIIRMVEFHARAQKAKSSNISFTPSNAAQEESARVVSEEPAEIVLEPQPQQEKVPAVVSQPQEAVAVSEPKPPKVKAERQTADVAFLIPLTEPARSPEPKPIETPPQEPLIDDEEDEEDDPVRKQEDNLLRFAPVEEPVEPADQPEPRQDILHEILRRLSTRDRDGLYQDFSLFKLLAWMIQIVAVFCLIASLGFLLSPAGALDRVLISLAYAAVLQLLVISLLLMHSRD